MNVLNGGAHADTNVDVQEFMLAPVGAASFAEALRWGAETYHALKALLHERGLSTALGDEGGFAPNLPSNEDALDAAARGDRARGLRRRATRSRSRSTSPSTELYDDGEYVLAGEGATYSRREFADCLAELCDRYPIVSIEDGMAEDDWDGWAALTERLGDRVQLVGDDLFVTNPERLAAGHRARRRQLDPGQGEPDRHAHRDARHDAARPAARLHLDDVAPQRRDRGRHDRRPRRRHELRADQDRRAGAQRPRREVQPAAAHRGGARPGRPRTSAARALAARSGG